jgi:hypothetical protein
MFDLFYGYLLLGGSIAWLFGAFKYLSSSNLEAALLGIFMSFVSITAALWIFYKNKIENLTQKGVG